MAKTALAGLCQLDETSTSYISSCLPSSAAMTVETIVEDGGVDAQIVLPLKLEAKVVARIACKLLGWCSFMRST